MQNMSRTMKEAIRSTYQAPLAKLEILNKDGSKAGEILDVIDVNLGVFSSRDILRSLRVSVDNKDGQYTPDPDLFDKNFLWYNKKMKLYYGFNVMAPKSDEMVPRKNMIKASFLQQANTEILDENTNKVRVTLGAGYGYYAEYQKRFYCEPSQNYSLKAYTKKISGSNSRSMTVLYYNEAGTYLGELGSSPIATEGWSEIRFTTPANTSYIILRLARASNIEACVVEYEFLQLEKGTTPTAYDPYFLVFDTPVEKEEWLPQGVFNIGYIRPEVTPDGITLELEGQDCIEDLHEDQFDDVYKAETTFTESANYALTPAGVATASSIVIAGDEIQKQAKIHYIDTFATINGLEKKVENGNNLIDRTIDDDFLNETAGQIPSKWSMDNGSPRVNSSSADGSNSVYFPGDGIYHRMRTKQSFPVTPGEYFTGSIKVKAGPEAGNTQLYFGIVWNTGAYTYFSNISGSFTSQDWFVQSGGLTVPDGVTSGQVWIFNYAGNSRSFYVDEVHVSGGDLAIDAVNIIDQNIDLGWGMHYIPKEGETVTKIESEVFIDLLDILEIQEIRLYLAHGASLTGTIDTSPDNATWTSHPSSPAWPGFVRFIKFRIKKETANPDGSFMMGIKEVQIKMDADYPAINAIDSNIYDTDWRPKPSDLNPWFQIDMGAAKSINAIYLSWGRNSFDFWNRVKYFIEHSTNGSIWTRLSDLNGYDETVSRYGDIEHVFNAISPRYIRITIRGVDGIAILRHVRIQSITATKTIRDMMTEILDVTTFAGKYQLPYTRRYVERKMADIGDEKAKFLRSLARSAGWEVNTDENGVYKAYVRNVNPVDFAWEFTPETDNIFSFGVTLSYDIKNVIVVTYESSDKKAIVGRAIDDNPLSPTSIQNLGRRVIHYSGESYNSQEICDKVAQERLFERTRQKHHTSLPITGHPGIQVDDVVILTVDEANVIQGFYLVTGFETTLKADNGEFDTRINISQI